MLQKAWGWTGFGEKKLWDVLQLLIVPVVLAGGVFYLQDAAKQRDLQIADDRAKQETLNRYVDQISMLLFDKKLRTAGERSEAQIVARARTLTVVRELDGERKGELIRFLREAELIESEKPAINLMNADLKNAYLYFAYLGHVNLSAAYLNTANLSNARLNNANLTNVDLNKANLNGAHLDGANLDGAILYKADLSNVILNNTNLRNAFLYNANLSKATIRGSVNLDGANLSRANLNGTSFDADSLEAALLCETTMPDGTKSDRDCDKLKSMK